MFSDPAELESEASDAAGKLGEVSVQYISRSSLGILMVLVDKATL